MVSSYRHFSRVTGIFTGSGSHGAQPQFVNHLSKFVSRIFLLLSLFLCPQLLELMFVHNNSLMALNLIFRLPLCPCYIVFRAFVLLSLSLLLRELTFVHKRVTFSACKTGLRTRQRAFSGLGLELGVDQSPSPADRLASRFDGLAGPFARLAEKRACAYFSSPSD
jgi:hypothetical protein